MAQQHDAQLVLKFKHTLPGLFLDPQVAQQHDALFVEDGVLNLVTRLHHNVLRTGLRRIRCKDSSSDKCAFKLYMK